MKYQVFARYGLFAVGLLVIIQAIPTTIECVIALIQRLGQPANYREYWFWVFVPTTIAALRLAIGLGLVLGARVWAKRLVPSDQPLCVACGYHLRGLGSTGRCPECGLEFHVSSPADLTAALDPTLQRRGVS